MPADHATGHTAAAAAPAPRRGPVPPLLGRVIEPVYSAAINRRNRRFDSGRGVTRLPIPIISVGNLSVGGTGKTPMVALLVGELLAAGRHPCIAMRGYGPRRATRSAAAKTDSAVTSDEAELYKQRFPALPIVAQPDRAAGLRALLDSPQGRAIDCIILDDGFQHRRLARDLDIVLIDASRSPFDDRLLPAGWLREPVSSLKRAHAVVITHAERIDAPSLARLTEHTARAHGRAPIAVTRHTWTGLTVTTPGAASDSHADVPSLRGKRTLTVCAIGNPVPFQAAAEHAAGSPDFVNHITLPDHDHYAPGTIATIARAAAGADLILTTEKDWTKLARLPQGTWPCPIARPRLDLTFDRGRADLLNLVLSATPPQVMPAP